MSEWQETTLGTCFDLGKSRINPKDTAPGTPYVGMEHLDPGSPRLSRFGSPDDVTSLVSTFKAGDVLFGRLRPYLRKVALADRDGVCSPEILVLRPTEATVPGFTYLLACSEGCIDHAVAQSAGSRMPRASATDLAAYPVTLPSVDEQRRFVDIVASVDRQIRALAGEVESIGAMHNAVAERLIFDGDWPLMSVKDMAIPKRGLVGGPFGSSLVSKDYLHSGVPVIRGTNMNGSGRFIGGDYAFVSEQKADSLRSNLGLPGDVVFTQRGTLGQVSMVPFGEYERYVVSQSQMRLRVNNKVNASYVFHTFSTIRMMVAVLGQNTATANPHINLGILAKMSAPMPSTDEQAQIVECLDASFKVVEELKSDLASLRDFRSTLVTALLSQSISVTESYDALLDLGPSDLEGSSA